MEEPGRLQFMGSLGEAAQGAPREPRRDSRGERSPWLPLETPALSGRFPGLPGTRQDEAGLTRKFETMGYAQFSP